MTESAATIVPSAARGLFAAIVDAGPRDTGEKRRPAWLSLLTGEIKRRRRFMEDYGWSVPTPDAMTAIATFAGERQLLEVGAGSGLWAFLLSCYGVSVTATDNYSWSATEGGAVNGASLPSGFSIPQGRFFPVSKLDVIEAVMRHEDHEALMMIWPPPDRPMALYALAPFKGDRVIFVGDPACSGDDIFHKELQLHWRLQGTIAIPQWPTIHDAVYLYERLPRRSQNPSLSSG